MKPTFKKLLAVASLLAASLFGLTPAAHATTPFTFNGITCNQYNGSPFPANGHYYDCTHGAPYTNYNANAQFVINNILNSVGFTKVKPVLQTAPSTSIFIFNDAVDMVGWFTTGAWGAPQKQAAWTTYKGVTGSSLDHAGATPCQSRIFVAYGSGVYPNEIIEGVSQFQGAVAHEVGHCFDNYANGSVPPSTRVGMTNKMVLDKAYMLAHDANGVNDFNTYAYWLNDSRELFAEEFSYAENGSSIAVDNLIANYYSCTLVYTKKWMSDQRDPTPAEYIALGLGRCN